MTERKGDTKRQHYVPRMILRNFSTDGKRISLVVEGKRIDKVSVRDQCQASYFYGADQVMEKSFADEEARMSAFFGDLNPARFVTLDADTVHQLRLFVAYRHARTRGAAEHYSKFVGAFAKQTLRDDLMLNGHETLEPEDLDLVEIGIKNAQNDAIWTAAKLNPVLLDMAVKFIKTTRTPGFVVADHPVVAYNQFAEHHPILSRYPTSTGLAAKGLQLFMPLSPDIVLAVYDPATYQYGGNSTVCTAGPTDVAFMNRMQAVNAYSCFYFDPARMDDAGLSDLIGNRAKHPSVYTKQVSTSDLLRHEDGRLSRFVAVHQTEVRVAAKLSFIRPLDGRSYEDHSGPSVPVRSPEFLEFAVRYGEELEAEVARRRAAKKTDDGGPTPSSLFPE